MATIGMQAPMDYEMRLLNVSRGTTYNVCSKSRIFIDHSLIRKHPMNKYSLFLTGGLLIAMSNSVLGAGCDNFPSVGLDVSRLAENRLTATASAPVDFDDVESVNEARQEAELEAKATFAKFLNEQITSDAVIDSLAKKISSQSSANPNAKQASVERTKTILKRIRSHSEALLRGVAVLGDCYTPGREVRVTVGFKPETLQAASNIQGAMSSSGAQNGSPMVPDQNAGMMNSQPVPAYSNRSQIDNF